jgi:hypothetical protein
MRPTESAIEAVEKTKKVNDRLRKDHIEGARALRRAKARISTGGTPRGPVARMTQRKANRVGIAVSTKVAT